MAIPEGPAISQPVHLQEPPPAESSDSSMIDGVPDQVPAQSPAQPATQSGPLTTDADRLVDQYRKIGQAEKHVYGQSAGGAPNFNVNLNPRPADAAPVPPGTQTPAPPVAQSPAPRLSPSPALPPLRPQPRVPRGSVHE